MAASNAVIDSSVLLAVLLGELGAETAAAKSVGSTLSSVNLAEVASRMVDQGASARSVLDAVETLSITIAAFGPDDAILAGALREQTKRQGLSLGDRACLALASRLGTVVYTADRRWAELDLGLRVELIR